jgi:hypothetical protein
MLRGRFFFDMTIESFLERPRESSSGWRGAARVRVDNLRSVVAPRRRDEIVWNLRFLHLLSDYAFRATASTPATPRDNGPL